MSIRKTAGLVQIILAVLLALEYFNILTVGLPLITLGAFILVIYQGWALVKNMISHLSFMGIIIPLIFAGTGLLYFFPIAPAIIQSNLTILIAAFLFTEGLYSLH